LPAPPRSRWLIPSHPAPSRHGRRFSPSGVVWESASPGTAVLVLEERTFQRTRTRALRRNYQMHGMRTMYGQHDRRATLRTFLHASVSSCQTRQCVQQVFLPARRPGATRQDEAAPVLRWSGSCGLGRVGRTDALPSPDEPGPRAHTRGGRWGACGFAILPCPRSACLRWFSRGSHRAASWLLGPNPRGRMRRRPHPGPRFRWRGGWLPAWSGS